MFVVIYRWHVKPGMEEHFREGWRRVTETMYRDHGSLGSRLHGNYDGTWLAYAQWPDRKHWERAREAARDSTIDGLRMMKESVDNPADLDLPVFRLVATDDLLHSSVDTMIINTLP